MSFGTKKRTIAYDAHDSPFRCGLAIAILDRSLTRKFGLHNGSSAGVVVKLMHMPMLPTGKSSHLVMPALSFRLNASQG